MKKTLTNSGSRRNVLFSGHPIDASGSMPGIAHDFNNILAIISGYAEMLQEDHPDQPLVTEKTSKILLAVDKARTLINQIIKFSGDIQPENVIVDLNSVLKETVGFVKATAKPGIRIRAVYCLEDTHVPADPTQLFRVFLNLMTNAIQAMEGKDGRLSVSTSIVDGGKAKGILNSKIQADSYVLTRFRDNGKGMDQTLIKRIFEPFFTSRETGKGTGLGLSVVHDIVSDLGGEIAVSSRPGHGSVFNIYLPFSTATENSALLKHRSDNLNRK